MCTASPDRGRSDLADQLDSCRDGVVRGAGRCQHRWRQDDGQAAAGRGEGSVCRLLRIDRDVYSRAPDVEVSLAALVHGIDNRDERAWASLRETLEVALRARRRTVEAAPERCALVVVDVLDLLSPEALPGPELLPESARDRYPLLSLD